MSEKSRLVHRGRERFWRFVGEPWEINADGEMIAPAEHVHSRERFMAIDTEKTFRDCVVTADFRILYAGGANAELIVRSLDNRRFYAIRFSPWWTSVWKGSADGYQRMLAYRRGAAGFDRGIETWCRVQAECVGSEILVFLDGNFIFAVRDEEYSAGCVGVGCTVGKAAWRNLVVEGEGVKPGRQWSVSEAVTPQQTTLFRRPQPGGMGCVNVHSATLLPEDEIFVGWHESLKEPHRRRLYTGRSRDYGLSWDKRIDEPGGFYLPTHHELWSHIWQEQSKVISTDEGNNCFTIGIMRSRDRGKSWSEREVLLVPFPIGRAYSPVLGNAKAIPGIGSDFTELDDGSIAFTCEFWRSTDEDWPVEGQLRSTQVQFVRSTDGGRSWTINPVDAFEWQRNETSWVQLSSGELVSVMRSDREKHLGLSRSSDRGKTWSRIEPIVPFFDSSAPALFGIRDNNGGYDRLVLAGRNWGLFTSIDEGRTWNLPTFIGGYCGSGVPAHMFQMQDGRILVIGDDDEQFVKAQFLTVDEDGMIHPAPLGPQR